MDISPDEMQERPAGDGHIFYKVQESRTHFKKMHDSSGHTVGHGQFSLLLGIIALQETAYIPMSIASGKKPSGFVYQIEGTGEGLISSTDISCKGEGVTQVTLGTLLYVKVPQGKTANFRIVVDTKGAVGREYKVVINRINYKLTPSDARYRKFDTLIETKTLKFR